MSQYISANVPTDLTSCTLVVAELKCIVDEVLNAVENTVDGLLNNLGITAQWTDLRGDYVSALCTGGLQILDLCVGAGLSGLGLRSDGNQ